MPKQIIAGTEGNFMPEAVIHRHIEILLVEDSPSDALLTREALGGSKLLNKIHVVDNGVDAIAFLRREGPFASVPRPDLILLDLNLPRMDGREVLREIKADDDLKAIPVVVLTSSDAEEDILKSYNLNANCYITKPVEFDKFVKVVRSIREFWFAVVTLPPQPYSEAIPISPPPGKG
jgi:two-component system response regulator